jgi:hypothetical protein
LPHRDTASRSAKPQRSQLFHVRTLTAALTLGLLVPLAGSAQAAPAQAAPAQAAPATAAACQPTPLTLIGASSTGLAVQQTGKPNAHGVLIDPVLTGPIGKRLTPRPGLDPTPASGPRTFMTVVGPNLAWYEYLQRAGSRPKAIHRTNILTGVDGEMPQPDAFNGDWFTHQVPSYAPLPSDWQRPLLRYRPTGTGPLLTQLIPNVPGVIGVSMAADATGLLRATLATDPTSYYSLDLVKLSTGEVTRLLDTTEVITRVALTAHTVAWATTAADGTVKINQRRRTGAGAVTSYVETNPHADVLHLVAGIRGVGYLVPDPGNPAGTALRIVNGATAHTVALPLGGAGLAAVGTRFYTAVGGGSEAGVYRVTGNRVRRVATVPC